MFVLSDMRSFHPSVVHGNVKTLLAKAADEWQVMPAGKQEKLCPFWPVIPTAAGLALCKPEKMPCAPLFSARSPSAFGNVKAQG